MSFGSLNDLLIINSFEEEFDENIDISKIDFLFSKTFYSLKKEFPNLKDDEIQHIILLLCQEREKGIGDKVDLVVTAPPTFSYHTEKTENIVENILNSAESSITMTGYSITEYIDKFIDVIVNKSMKGVFVRLFINDIEKQEATDKIRRYSGKFLNIYSYQNNQDKMSALHAKVISIDKKLSLISSANLSYHWMSGNIEVGCKIESENLAKNMDNFFNQLIYQKIFKKI